MKVLVTGAAGFIGSAVAEALLDRGDKVYGIDSINAYYNVDLKFERMERLGISSREIMLYRKAKSRRFPKYTFQRMNVDDERDLRELFRHEGFDVVCHFAAQAGIRYSSENPRSYIDSNVTGMYAILEACRCYPIEHFLFASSSSVYGEEAKVPFSEHEATDTPVSFYAATKKAGELMAYSYSHLFNIPITGLRYFTVYGPRGRPDMALFKFTEAIFEGKPVEVYHNGRGHRDWTYIDDAVALTLLALDTPPSLRRKKKPAYPLLPLGEDNSLYKIYNVGFGQPHSLNDLIKFIEVALDKGADIRYVEAPKSDVPLTWADTGITHEEFGYVPKMRFGDGVRNFVEWYLEWREKK
jgi:UDP-glucuronate 4-epimerase